METGSGDPAREKVSILLRDEFREIAELKIRDLNATSIEAAERIIEGAARSMGIKVE